MDGFKTLWSSSNRNKTNRGGVAPIPEDPHSTQFIPPYLDARWYDKCDVDREEESQSSMTDFNKQTSSTNANNAYVASNSFVVSSFNTLKLLSSSSSSQLVTKDNREKFIICKPVQTIQVFHDTVFKNDRQEGQPISRNEWLAVNTIAIFKCTDIGRRGNCTLNNFRNFRKLFLFEFFAQNFYPIFSPHDLRSSENTPLCFRVV